MLGIVESRQRAPLRRSIDVEGLAHALHQADQLLRADAVTDAHSGQAVQLREGSQRKDRAVARMVADRVRVIGVRDVFKISFVDDQKDIRRDLAEKMLPFRAAKKSSRSDYSDWREIPYAYAASPLRRAPPNRA